MAETTNLANELFELCEKLDVASKDAGDIFLAEAFGVIPWTRDFFQVLSAITERIDALEQIIESLNVRQTVKSNAIQHLERIRGAFDKNALVNPWQQYGLQAINAPHRDPILSISAALTSYDFVRPSNDERLTTLEESRELLEWLEDFQLSENDFVRDCIIVGLKQFIFRLERMDWFGWAQTAASLSELLSAYLALERGLDAEAHPQAVALMRKVLAKLSIPLKILSGGRELKENGDFALAVWEVTKKIGTHAIAASVGFLPS